MSDESKNSECNIDPCLVTEENAPRLTDFSLVYPQRVYCRQVKDDEYCPREIIAYSDYALLWEEDHHISRRIRSLLGLA